MLPAPSTTYIRNEFNSILDVPIDYCDSDGDSHTTCFYYALKKANELAEELMNALNFSIRSVEELRSSDKISGSGGAVEIVPTLLKTFQNQLDYFYTLIATAKKIEEDFAEMEGFFIESFEKKYLAGTGHGWDNSHCLVDRMTRLEELGVDPHRY